jgi:hypothetical protein
VFLIASFIIIGNYDNYYCLKRTLLIKESTSIGVINVVV